MRRQTLTLTEPVDVPTPLCASILLFSLYYVLLPLGPEAVSQLLLLLQLLHKYLLLRAVSAATPVAPCLYLRCPCSIDSLVI